MIRPAEVRAAAETMKAFRKQQRKSRPKPAPVAKGQREVRERDPGFLAYLRRQPCEARHLGGCEGAVQAAHVRYSDAAAGRRNPGMQRKGHDRDANPLCRAHHLDDQHQHAERFFWQRVGKDAYATAAAHFAEYQGVG